MNIIDKTPDDYLRDLISKIQSTDSETISLSEASGRVLAAPVVADRDSPAADVSAMDGYAIRKEHLLIEGALPVEGESAPGHAPPDVSGESAMRVFTGGIVPQVFDLVLKREDTEELASAIRLTEDARKYRAGQNIRRQGENARIGSTILPAGTRLHGGAIAAAANFGSATVQVTRRLRITILVTGDELNGVDAQVQPWQLRDSNGPTLEALFSGKPWLEIVSVDRVVDKKDSLEQRLAQAIEASDAVILTGGVSMGDYDFVPGAVKQSGGEIVFHRLPIRPGKPILGAVSAKGTPVIGLPGNPVSAAVGCVRFVLPLLEHQAGAADRVAMRPKITLSDPDEKQIPLNWFRLVKIDNGGSGRLVVSQGSGDLVSLSASDGFVEMPPNSSGPGPWKFWGW